jgi:hypothetical protein
MHLQLYYLNKIMFMFDIILFLKKDGNKLYQEGPSAKPPPRNFPSRRL